MRKLLTEKAANEFVEMMRRGMLIDCDNAFFAKHPETGQYGMILTVDDVQIAICRFPSIETARNLANAILKLTAS
jgi:hypothetical protein